MYRLTHTYTHLQKYMFTYPQRHIHTYICSHPHIDTSIHIHINTGTQSHIHTHIEKHLHIFIHIHRHTYIHICMHMQTHVTCTQTQSLTHFCKKRGQQLQDHWQRVRWDLTTQLNHIQPQEIWLLQASVSISSNLSLSPGTTPSTRFLAPESRCQNSISRS